MRRWFEDLIGSFYSAPLYVRRLRHGSDTGFVWLLFVCLLSALVMIAGLQFAVLTKGDKPVLAIIEQMPVLHFEAGRLHTDPAGPHSVAIEGHEFMIIDDAIEGLHEDLAPNRILIGRDYMVTRQAGGKVTAQPHDWIGTRDVTQDDLRGWWAWWKRWGWAPLTFVMFLYYYFGFGALMLAMSLVALLLAKLTRVPADFNAALRITALALTPAIVLNLLNHLTGNHLPLSNWACAGLTLAYLMFAMRKTRFAPPELPV